jgi:hypothetical protein
VSCIQATADDLLPLRTNGKRVSHHGHRQIPETPEELHRTIKRSMEADMHQAVLLVSRHPSKPILEDVTEFYQELYRKEEEKHDPMSVYEDSTMMHDYPIDADLKACYNEYNVLNAIQSYPVGKAAGHDNIDPVLMKCLSQSSVFLRQLTLLYQACMEAGYTPQRWNVSVIIPIPKAKPIDTDPRNKQVSVEQMRPVSLTVLFRRIFESILLRYVDNAPLAETLRKLQPSQAGFRRGYSTMTQALLSHESSQLGNKGIKIFIDLKQAYDRVPLDILFQRLSHRIPRTSKVFQILKTLFTGCSSRVLVKNILSDEDDRIHRERGLFQGSLLSPWLFNLFIDDLACWINEDAENEAYPKGLFFADDIELQATTFSEAQRLLNKVSQWTSLNGMKVNVAKAVFLSRKAEYWEMKVCVCGSALKIQDTYKYLGFIHTQRASTGKVSGCLFSKGISCTAILCPSLSIHGCLAGASQDPNL